jgi:hypothetical protein
MLPPSRRLGPLQVSRLTACMHTYSPLPPRRFSVSQACVDWSPSRTCRLHCSLLLPYGLLLQRVQVCACLESSPQIRGTRSRPIVSRTRHMYRVRLSRDGVVQSRLEPFCRPSKWDRMFQAFRPRKVADVRSRFIDSSTIYPRAHRGSLHSLEQTSPGLSVVRV